MQVTGRIAGLATAAATAARTQPNRVRASTAGTAIPASASRCRAAVELLPQLLAVPSDEPLLDVPADIEQQPPREEPRHFVAEFVLKSRDFPLERARGTPVLRELSPTPPLPRSAPSSSPRSPTPSVRLDRHDRRRRVARSASRSRSRSPAPRPRRSCSRRRRPARRVRASCLVR